MPNLEYLTGRKAMFKKQAPATLSQAAPVQNTWYTVLTAQINCRVYQIALAVATTNETLQSRIIIDGQTFDSGTISATAGTEYHVNYKFNSDGTQIYGIATQSGSRGQQGILLEGLSVQIQVRKTTAAGAGTITAAVDYGLLEKA